MTVELWTARISTRDPDRFDVTRKSGGPLGVDFAPSWEILRPALDARSEAVALRFAARAGEYNQTEAEGDAAAIEAEAWERYVPAYTEEMRKSYRRKRTAWEALLARPRVVLVCYCVTAVECHRSILAGIFGKLGADVRGELTPKTVARTVAKGGSR